MSKRYYVIDLWGRGGEISFHELTKAGYAMTYNRAWEYESHWDLDYDSTLDRMKEKGLKNETFYWHEGQPQYRCGMHQNLDTCWLDVYETTEEHLQDYPDEEKDEWTKINKEQLDAKFDLKCVFSREELFQTDSDVKEFEEEWEDSERTMTPLLGLYSDEKGSYGTWTIELEEELDPKRIVYTVAETQFGDMVDWWGYVTKDNKIVHFDTMHPPEGDTKGMYASLGWKLDSEKWDSDIPWDECEKAIADGEIEFD